VDQDLRGGAAEAEGAEVKQHQKAALALLAASRNCLGAQAERSPQARSLDEAMRDPAKAAAIMANLGDEDEPTDEEDAE
jgi:hypothetical protein